MVYLHKNMKKKGRRPGGGKLKENGVHKHQCLHQNPLMGGLGQGIPPPLLQSPKLLKNWLLCARET